MYNDDVEIALCRPREEQDYFYRNGEGDEVIFVHEGSRELETTFGTLPYHERDYIVIPRGTTYRFVPDGDQLWLTFHTPGRDRDPEPLPQPLRADARARAVLAPRLPSADRAAHPPRARASSS